VSRTLEEGKRMQVVHGGKVAYSLHGDRKKVLQPSAREGRGGTSKKMKEWPMGRKKNPPRRRDTKNT